MVLTQEEKNIFYLQQICADLEYNIHKLPWANVVIKNCDDDGRLLSPTSVQDYKTSKRALWINLELALFKKDTGEFPVWCCPECPSMRGVKSLGVQNSEEDIMPYLCIHSRAANFLLPNWETIWNVRLTPGAESNSVICNEDISVVTCMEFAKTGLFLAAIRAENKIHLLFTVTKRQRAPFCSSNQSPQCTTQSCKHFRSYEAITTADGYRQIFCSRFGGNLQLEHEVEEEHVNENEEVQSDEEVHDDHEDNDATDVVFDHVSRGRHYANEMGEKEFAHKCGFNFTKIPYPFFNCSSMQTTWLKRQKHIYDFPDVFVPEFEPDKKCEVHGNTFDENDDNLIQKSKNSVVYNEIGDQIFSIKVMSRRTIGNCNCRQRYDGHSELIWHLGKGRFVNYSVLVNYLHNFVNDGLSINAQYESIQANNKSFGVTTDLTYADFHRSVVGFVRNLQFDEKEAFSCPTHGSRPRWITADGKSLGPAKKHCKGLSELDSHPDDLETLTQSTKFKERVFLSNSKERSAVCSLLGNQMSMQDFLICPDITTDNGRLLQSLIQYLDQNGYNEIPNPYRRLMKNICMPTSARGLLQVSNFLPLDYLVSFCQEEMPLKDVGHIEELRCVSTELPVVWPILNDICNLQNTAFLPQVVSRIVIQIVEIRNNTFIHCESRADANYIPYNGQEHPTMFFPNHRLKFYPKRYKVNQKIDKDVCKKAFTGHKDFTSGIFTIGCGCPHNTTFGFELMLNKESPRNLFRILQCRDFDQEHLQGILIDHACLVDRYILNREAPMLEWKKLLVDGAHWRAQKKFKAHNPNTRRGGHIGCSESFNWNLYKQSVDEQVNSQGREQMHSLVEKCSKSLRLMSYENFMVFMKVFFAMTNLKNR